MSHIFDALQRSEDERLGVDSPPLSEATELLRRAERRASSDWVNASFGKKDVAPKSEEQNASFEIRAAATVAEAKKAPPANEQILPDENRRIFSQFQTVQMAIPPHNRLTCFSDDESPGAEAFRLLGVRLRHLRRSRPLKRVLVTSTVPAEGKSMVAANLACTLGSTKHEKILLLEGDLRRPSLSGTFGIGRNPGLCECLKAERTLARCIYYLEGANIWILPAGSAQSNALELLQSRQQSAIMDQLAEWFDWIIIDSPPVLPLGDTSVWTRFADGVLLVTRQGTTEKRHLQRGIEALDPKKLIGALLNCSQSSSEYNYYHRAADASAPSDGTKS